MHKPLPPRVLRRLLLLTTASLASSTYTLAQTISLPQPLPRAVSPADTVRTPGTPPELNKAPIPAVFTPAVTDENGEPLMGVRLATESGSLTALSDSVGHAPMPGVTAGEKLIVSIDNSEIQRFEVGDDLVPSIILDTKNPAVARLKPLRLLFNTSLRPDLTAASTQTIYYRDLQKFPVTSFLNALSGQVAGLQTFSISGLPGGDVVGASLLGQSPTIVIDGIVRPIYAFDLEEIESVTVLKDALSTSMLGVRGSNNGVLNVTTRRGTPGLPRISFTVQSAIQQPLKQPNALNSYDYARLYNEARTNDGLAPVYTDADLQAYRDGTDPIGHPNVNWRDQVLKKSSQLNRYTFSASGGNVFAKYFVSLEHLKQSGLLKTSDINKYNTSNEYKSYTVRSNVDLQLNRKLSAGIHLLGRVLNANDAGVGTATILNSIVNTPANAYPVYNSNGTYGGTSQFPNNAWAQTVGSGYQQNYQRDVIADVYLKRTLSELTPGLWVRAIGSYYASLSENIFRNKTYATFQQTAAANGEATYQQFGVNSDQNNSSIVGFQNNTVYLEGALGYERQLGQHGLNAIALVSRQAYTQNSDLPYTSQGVSGRASYNYQGKYVAELAFGLNGVNRYPSNGSFRYGFFPAGGLAWNISREEFLKSQTWLSALKLYGSIGLTGNERNTSVDYFSYIQTYFDTSGPYFGTGAGQVSGISEQVLATVNRTWEKARKLHAGIQGAVLDNHLGFTLEYYNSKYYDLLQQRGRSTTLIGQTYPDENIGQNRYSGFTVQLSYQNTAGPKFSYFFTANAGRLNPVVLFADEVARPYPWMERTGRRVGQQFGYIAEGLFQNEADIANHAVPVGYAAKPGDIKYKDLNGDGIIDQLDQAAIGTIVPTIPLGASLGFRWGAFDFSVLAQGVLNRSVYLSGSSEYAFQNGGFGPAFSQHLDRWTPDNPNATYPRLTVGTNPNNQAISSFWIHDNSYVRIKNAEVGYTLPLTLSRRARLQGVRLFANGTNLLTFSQYNRIDPEVFNNAYPQQRLLNFGLNVKL
ncbi:SusC/RagA family TonB-linked outer membrane protein [Hymenobacter sp. GOD-10R]|uniref:SusC/RagA family TonB-linked outer membrane protein n=1 Tax=Hymenobacter sp. GOD-10R TaxID=3093922 RepID=UPI002D77EC08|nr:SusC/RagA family TonB-linked outer membrane protein [Hymenobacter sp. GOD-10R]WRQ28533.1 SusC/RagA family TonB-linked outer membrane protein [Hymenobacter sp. GOD-10R]